MNITLQASILSVFISAPFKSIYLFFGLLSGIHSFVSAQSFSEITWSTGASQPYNVSEAQGRVVKGKLYSFGGFDSQKSTFTPTKRAYVFDPANGTWTAIADLPFTPNGTNFGGVTHAGITTDGADIFIAGGYTSNTAGTGQIFGSREVYKYNVVQNTYSRLPDLPQAIASGQLEFLNGKLHYIGGTNAARTIDLTTHYVLELANLSAGWSTAAPVPNGRNHAGSVVFDGNIYFIGGQHGQDSKLSTQKEVDIYDPAKDTWTKAADLPVPAGANGRGHISSGVTVMGNRILVLGGEIVHQTSINMVSAYTPATNTWQNLTPLPANRFSGVAGSINGVLYYTGGSYSKTTFKGIPHITSNVLTLNPVADAYTRDGGFSNTNFGTDREVIIKNANTGYQRFTYMKFSLSGTSGISSAKLRIYGRNMENSNTYTLNVYAMNDSWTENSITFNNAPSASELVGSVAVNSLEKYYEIDVTAFVQSRIANNEDVSLLIKDPAFDKILFQFNSRENNMNRPELVLNASNENGNSLLPVADAYTRDGAYAGSNYGTEDELMVKTAIGGYTRQSFLKFSLSGQAEIAKAKLRLYGRNTENNTSISLNIYGVSDDSWTETGINFNNAPASSTSSLGVMQVNGTPAYYEVDVTPFVQQQINGDKVASFVIKDLVTNKILIDFNSRENGSNQPQLILTGTANATLNLVTVSEEGPHESVQPLVFPNPSGGRFYLQVSDHFTGPMKVNLYDITGKRYDVDQFNIPHGGLDVNIDLAKFNLRSGVYYLHIVSRHHSRYIPIIISR